jgi:hypothetical protein
MAAQEIMIVSGLADERQTVFSVLVKRSYDVVDGQALVQREQCEPFQRGDVYYDHGDPEGCTVLYEDELAPFKPATDVVFIAQAHSPQGRPIEAMNIGVEVGGQRKIMHVIGDRIAHYRKDGAPSISDPKPFTTMPVRYELAYGGKDLHSRPEAPFYYPRNPLGRGIAVLNVREAVNGLRLPNLEDPDDALTPERIVLGDESRWNAQPLPQGLGWFQKTWYPRCSFVGAFPGYVDSAEVMREEHLELVPRGQIALARRFRLPSFDVRFNNGASLGLAFRSLGPGTPIRLARLTPEGHLGFALPDRWPKIMLDIGLGENELSVALHTVSVRVEERRAGLIWRGAHPFPGIAWLPEMRELRFEVQ